MSASNFQAVMGLVLQHEGGYTNDRRDPGNWTGGKVGVGKLLGTKYGIAANTFPNLDIANITRAQAIDIYRRQYATPVRFDDLPAGVDYAVLDIAINSGTSKAGLILQGALAKLGQRVKVDGHVGDATVTAAAAVRASDLIDAVSDARLAYMKRLKNWPTYGKGWTRRVGEVRTLAKGMANPAASPVSLFEAQVEPAPSARGANAAKVAITKLKGIKTAAVTALSVIGEKSADILAEIQPYADVGTIKTICTVLTVISVTYGLYRLLKANGSEGQAANAEAAA